MKQQGVANCFSRFLWIFYIHLRGAAWRRGFLFWSARCDPVQRWEGRVNPTCPQGHAVQWPLLAGEVQNLFPFPAGQPSVKMPVGLCGLHDIDFTQGHRGQSSRGEDFQKFAAVPHLECELSLLMWPSLQWDPARHVNIGPIEAPTEDNPAIERCTQHPSAICPMPGRLHARPPQVVGIGASNQNRARSRQSAFTNVRAAASSSTPSTCPFTAEPTSGSARKVGKTESSCASVIRHHYRGCAYIDGACPIISRITGPLPRWDPTRFRGSIANLPRLRRRAPEQRRHRSLP